MSSVLSRKAHSITHKSLKRRGAHPECIFCKFIHGYVKTHGDGLLYIPLKKTKSTVSFLSKDLPKNRVPHVLLIPRAHHHSIHGIAKQEYIELFDHLKEIIKVLREFHGGCNVLINDGSAAGQTVPHVHIHIIARDDGDGIEIERWPRGKISTLTFYHLSRRLKKALSIV